MSSATTSAGARIGIAVDQLHAVDARTAEWADQHRDTDGPGPYVPAECRLVVILAAPEWGAFEHGNERLTTRTLCPSCRWIVALEAGTVEAELAAVGPDGDEQVAWRRLLTDPDQFSRTCRAVLAARDAEQGYDRDSPYWAAMLGYLTAHRPELLVQEDCAEGGCDHDGRAGCYAEHSIAVCAACSLHAGDWAGEWSGQVEVRVPAPCSVLVAMAAMFVDTPAGG